MNISDILFKYQISQGVDSSIERPLLSVHNWPAPDLNSCDSQSSILIHKGNARVILRHKPCKDANNRETANEKKPLKETKLWYLIHILSDKVFKGTVVNQALSSLVRKGHLKLGLQSL